MKPKYTHDCSACKFLEHFEAWSPRTGEWATWKGADLYVCGDTILARFSDKGSDYSSTEIESAIRLRDNNKLRNRKACELSSASPFMMRALELVNNEENIDGET